jgi:alpha-tubulin suppressor-like RCC1 family protein
MGTPTDYRGTIGDGAGEVAALGAIDLGVSLGVKQLAMGDLYACALIVDGQLKCWGYSDYGNLGVPDGDAIGDSPSEMGSALAYASLGTGLRVKSIDANYMRTCAIFTDGRLKCFGYNRYGGAGAGLTDQTLGATASELGDALPFVDLGTDRYAVKVSVGTEHTCAILDNGSVKCWGRNDVGQLGLDDTTDRGATAASMGDALNTVNLGSGRKAIDISAGTDHTCALLDNATIKCWGSNTSGQLGIGTSTVAVGDSTGDMAALSAVSLGLSAVPIKVSVGGSSSCAILAGGSLKCWGKNGNGQLGIGSTTDVGTTSSQMGNNLAAIDLGTGEVAIDVSIALNTACAVVQDSGIKCWGSNTAGQLGIGSTSSVGTTGGQMGNNLAEVPLSTTGLATTKVVAGGNHTCALQSNSTVKCWGDNAYAQLARSYPNDVGISSGEMAALPVIDFNGGGISDVAPGGNHTCAISVSQTVKCWGLNSSGQLGLGNTNTIGDVENEVAGASATVNIGTSEYAVQLDAGDTHTCAVTATSTVKCWGGNGSGQLGIGNTNTIGDGGSEMGSSLAAIDLGSGRSVQSVSAGGNHTCAIVDSGDVKCWGSNISGQLGIRSTLNAVGDGAGEMGSSLTTTFVGAAIQVAAGREHTCALFFDGTVKCWGDNFYGQLGRANTTDIGRSALSMGIYLSSINLGSGRTATQIAVGNDHTCALLDDGTLKCWGRNGSGQLGRGDKLNYGDSSLETISSLAALSFGARRIVSISAGVAHTCAHFGDGSARCWGENSDGQLGRDSMSDYGLISSQTMSSLSAITVIETTAPAGTFNPHPSPYGLRTVVFDFDLAETATGITSADFVSSGSASGCVVTATPVSTTYVLVQADCFSDGTVTVTMNTGTMTDASGNTGPTTTISSNTVTMDTTSPTAALTSPVSPTGSTNLAYSLVFSEDVTGLGVADFTATGTASPCTITPVAISGSTYRIDLACASTGTAGLSMRSSAVTDGAGNNGPATTTTATSVTIDASIPSASWSTTSTSGTSRTVVFDLEFSEAVTGLSAIDISTAGTATCSAPLVAGSGVNFTATYSCSTDGTVIPTLLAGSVTDVSLNNGPATAVTSAGFTIDGSAPSATWTAPTSPTNSLTPSFELDFGEPVSGLISSDIAVVTGAGAAPCSITGVTGSGAEYTVGTTCTAEGTVTLSIASATVVDSAGNSGPTSPINSTTITIDRTAPTVVITPSATLTGSRIINATATWSEPITEFDTSDLATSGTAPGCAIGIASSTSTSANLFVLCAGDGTLTISVNSGSAIDSASNSGPSIAVSAATVTIDSSIPSATWSEPASPVGTRTPTFILSFNQAITGLAASDITNIGTAGACSFAVNSTTDLSSYEVVPNCPSDGEVQLSLAIGAVNNSSMTSGPTTATESNPVVIDTNFLSTIWSSPSSTAGSLTASYIINFGETVFGISAADFSNLGTASGCSFTVGASSGTSISVSATCTSTGTLNVVLLANSSTDAAGNTGPATDTAATSVSLVSIASTPTGLITLSPKRIMDTRSTGKIGSRTGTAASTTFNVYNKGGLPTSGISAVVLNVTVVDPEVGNEGGYLSVYPCASGQPDVSNLNFTNGMTIPNTVIAPVDPSGNICFYSYGKTHVLADVSGYFPTGSSLTTLSPKRIMDTRSTGKIGSRTGTAASTTFNVYSKGGLPASGISAVVLNVTVVDPEVGNEGGYLSVYPCASGQPDVSNLNFTNGLTIPNTVIAPVDTAGNICFYSYGKTHVLADVSGYFPTS